MAELPSPFPDPVPVPPPGRLRALAARLPPAPPGDLDPLLDAAVRCFARHGLRRTTVQDVARELGVDRTTVYRRAGGVDHIASLLLAREVHRLVAALPAHLPAGADPLGPDGVIELMAAAISLARHHGVVAKVMADEVERVGPLMTTQLRSLLDRVVAGVRPLLEEAMAGGSIASGDADRLAEWLVRIGVSLIVTPARGDLRAFLAEVLLPVLDPTRGGGGAA